jgi:hypothetical protein
MGRRRLHSPQRSSAVGGAPVCAQAVISYTPNTAVRTPPPVVSAAAPPPPIQNTDGGGEDPFAAPTILCCRGALRAPQAVIPYAQIRCQNTPSWLRTPFNTDCMAKLLRRSFHLPHSKKNTNGEEKAPWAPACIHHSFIRFPHSLTVIWCASKKNTPLLRKRAAPPPPIREGRRWGRRDDAFRLFVPHSLTVPRSVWAHGRAPKSV